MRWYHHIGIPTAEPKPGETHLKHLKLFVVSHEKSEFGVEWMRFEADAGVPDLVRQVPHVAFEVADLASRLAGRALSSPPPPTTAETTPSPPQPIKRSLSSTTPAPPPPSPPRAASPAPASLRGGCR